MIAIWRTRKAYRTGHVDMPLTFGDALLLQGLPESITILQTEPELLVLASQTVSIHKQKALLASLVMLATLIMAAFAPFSTRKAMLGGALVMVLVGVLNMDQAYRAIEWKSVFKVFGKKTWCFCAFVVNGFGFPAKNGRARNSKICLNISFHLNLIWMLFAFKAGI